MDSYIHDTAPAPSRLGGVILALFLALPMVVSGAGDAELDRATLRGLKAVGVVIDRIDPQLPRAGVDAAALQERLESRLKDAEIPLSEAANEFVGIQISAVRGNRGPYALSMTIGLYQPVLLARDHNIRTATKTWEVETIVMAEPKVVRQASLDSIDELAGRFVTAWRAVNGGK